MGANFCPLFYRFLSWHTASIEELIEFTADFFPLVSVLYFFSALSNVRQSVPDSSLWTSVCLVLCGLSIPVSMMGIFSPTSTLSPSMSLVSHETLHSWPIGTQLPSPTELSTVKSNLATLCPLWRCTLCIPGSGSCSKSQ